jgi:YD repeat-containing protein
VSRFAVAVLSTALLNVGCGLLDDNAAAAWCDEGGVDNVTEVRLSQERDDGVIVDRFVSFRDAEGRTLATIYSPDSEDIVRTDYVLSPTGQVLESREDVGADGNVEDLGTTTYDSEDRPETLLYDRGNDGTVDVIVTWDYSVPDQETSLRDADADGDTDSTETWIYSTKGELLREERDYDADGTAEWVATHVYTESGLPLESTETAEFDVSSWTFEYDEEDRLVRRTQTYEDLVMAGTSEETYEYNDAGILTSSTTRSTWTEDGITTEQVTRGTYDGEGRLLRSESRDLDGALLSTMAYEYGSGDEPVRTTRDADGDGTWDFVTTRAQCAPKRPIR